MEEHIEKLIPHPITRTTKPIMIHTRMETMKEENDENDGPCVDNEKEKSAHLASDVDMENVSSDARRATDIVGTE